MVWDLDLTCIFSGRLLMYLKKMELEKEHLEQTKVTWYDDTTD